MEEPVEKEEEWREIVGFPEYLISDLGNVWTSRKQRLMKPSINREGYLYVHLPGRKLYKIHRVVAIAFIPNPDAKNCVDHRDGNPSNNRVDNLRWATHAENSRNCKMPKNNSSGVKGVYFNKRLNNWRAVIHLNGKYVHIGHYETIEEATAAYQEKAREHFGEFYRES
jgi:hypothetical protein